MSKIRVLVVDDSILFRKVIVDNLEAYSQIEVVGTARDVYEARDKILELKPDVMTLDIQMPKMNGIEFLKRLLPQYPLPVVVVSSVSESVFDAMNAGAVDFVTKPTEKNENAVKMMITDMVEKIEVASKSKISRVSRRKTQSITKSKPRERGSVELIAIGASTGGTEAIATVLKGLIPPMPPVVIVQHMPPVFTNLYAKRMDNHCAFKVEEAVHNSILMNDCVYIAPGDKHMIIKKRGNHHVIVLEDTEKVSGHKPSVDVLFYSISKLQTNKTLGVLLTGMGSDGAKGLLSMKKKCGFTIGQDEKSSIVYGMPKVAYEIGAVDEQVALDRIANRILELV